MKTDGFYLLWEVYQAVSLDGALEKGCEQMSDKTQRRQGRDSNCPRGEEMTLERTHLVVGAGETWNQKDPVLPKGIAAVPPNAPLMHSISLLQKGEKFAPEKQTVASPSNFACQWTFL